MPITSDKYYTSVPAGKDLHSRSKQPTLESKQWENTNCGGWKGGKWQEKDHSIRNLCSAYSLLMAVTA